MHRISKTWILFLIITMFVYFQTDHPVMAGENHDELFVLIGDSLMKAKAEDKATVAKNIEQFSSEWKSMKNAYSKQGKKVDQELKKIQSLLDKKNVEKAELTKSLSSLSSAVVLYDEEQHPKDKEKGKKQVEGLLSLIKNLNASLAEKNTASTKTDYQTLMNQWNKAETIVHDESIASYGNIEKYLALIRIAITQDPADLSKAATNADHLKAEVEMLLAGKVSKQVTGDYTLSDLSNLLSDAEREISNGNIKKANNDLNEILNIWPIVEGDVQTRDSRLYSDIETKIPAAISLLSSKNVDKEKAQDIVKNIHSRLDPLTSKTDYSMWDAALILLREGLEGLLIVATLLAFLKKTDQSSKQKWIWAGVTLGIVASAILAVIINIIFSKITAASSREYIEGITGIVAVVMMLTISAWLHNKSSIANWNRYLDQQMKQAIAKGSLFSFAFISFLSVFREGAETIIFYTGITPYISLQQLVIGIILAIFILAIAGFAVIHYSVKIPIHLFFKVATILIYFLAFKILGISIHALQISNVIPTSTMDHFLFIDWIGLYPTWETTLSQILLIAIIVFLIWMVKKRTNTKKRA